VSPGERDLEREFNVIRAHGLEPRGGDDPFERTYNAAPSMFLPVVRLVDGSLVVERMQWGFIPRWWSREELPESTINARAEDAATKPMWREAVRNSRALIPALGYYEWAKRAGAKVPFHIRRAHGIDCFAGLWSEWAPRHGKPIKTFAILTMDAASPVAAIHSRMPLVLPREWWRAWLDPERTDGAALLNEATAHAVRDFDANRVSSYVSSPRNQGEECIRPVADGAGL
jgi:putative SOS response-associated peptidase YedK